MSTDDELFRPPSSESLAARYETSNVSIKSLAVFVVGLVVSAAVIHVAMWILLVKLVHADESKDNPASALATSAPPPPSVPRIQPSKPEDTLPREDLQAMYQGEDEAFRKMGWKVDANSHAITGIPAPVITAVTRDADRRRQSQGQTR